MELGASCACGTFDFVSRFGTELSNSLNGGAAEIAFLVARMILALNLSRLDSDDSQSQRKGALASRLGQRRCVRLYGPQIERRQWGLASM